MGNGSASAPDGDGWRVRCACGKEVRSGTARNSLSNGLDVDSVRAAKQRRKLEVGVVRLIGVKNVSIIESPHKMERISELPGVESVGIGFCSRSNVSSGARSGRAAENPNGFTVIVLARIDVDVQLRLALFQRGKTKQSGSG